MNPNGVPKSDEHKLSPRQTYRERLYIADDADGLVEPGLRNPVIVLCTVLVANVPQSCVQQATSKFAQTGDVGPPGAIEPADAEKQHIRGVLNLDLCVLSVSAPYAQTPKARVLVPRGMRQFVAEAYVIHQFIFVNDAPQVRENLGATRVDSRPFRLPKVDRRPLI